MEKIKVVIVPVEEEAYITEVENNLEELKKIVDGYLETIPTETDDVLVVCNEEGMIHNLPQNVLGIYGTFFIVGIEGSEFVSLNKYQAETVLEYVKKI
ncbi:DUF3846 domain-containing protein [Virgibacillus sp. DJP39]|uniref:DUF3846 domain-containing protein n=1 Tax=Virgibacillus sp. DJP39 TaxID=3409790 RepID=UPI003BB5A4DA